ncbi:MAG: HNH endonuclease [Actinobacteria bacterium]|nr:HNH endonuclease [Actinomycetota bacterium]
MFDPAMDAPGEEATYDFGARVDDLRCHPTDVLRKLLGEAGDEEQRWRLERVAITRVLDEREALDGRDTTISARTARSLVEVGRALEQQPAIAAAAHAGELTWDQLEPVVEIATPDTDEEWAARGQRCSPSELRRLARRTRRVSTETSDARIEARNFSIWRRPEAGMVSFRGDLPDIDGVLAEAVLERMIDRMKPAPGQPWDTRAHRMADAFMDLVRNYADADPATKGSFKPLVMVQVRADDPDALEANGVAVAKRRLAEFLADVPPRATRQVVDDLGGLVPSSDLDQESIPAEVRRFVLARDRECRTPGCERPAREIHHMDPRSTGGTHDPKKLAGVCVPCHHGYEPHGPWRLVGDPDVPGDLRRIHRDDDRSRDGPDDGPSP